ncbi:MAG: hypothetical protein ABJA80_00615 [bacterium]
MDTLTFLALATASITPDVLDAAYQLLGICNPNGLYSHTIPVLLLQAAVVSGVALLVTGSRVTAALFGLVVLLHAPADYFTGRKLFAPGGELVGLLWYDRPMLDFTFESAWVLAGWWLLRRSGRGPRWAASIGVLVFLLVVQAAFDIHSAVSDTARKPSACFPVWPPER